MTLGTLSFFVLVWLFPIGKKGCRERDLPAPTYIWKTARRRDRFDGGGEEFASFCTLAAAFARLAGVHFLFCFSAGMVVSTVAWRNLSPCARWPLPFFASPACIFYSVSPPDRAPRRCRRGFCLLLHAGRYRSSLCRRAFLILFLRRHGRFDGGAEEFISFCTLAAAVLRLAGGHFLFYFSAGMVVSTVPARNLSPFARWPLPLLASPACIFHSISPPARSF